MSHRSRRPSDPRLQARIALGAVKIGVLAAISGLAVGTAAQADPTGGDVLSSAQQPPARVLRMLERHHCSTTGFGQDQQPGSAIVRSAAGRLRFVDFDTGWRIYTRHGPATLVAVCLDDPPA
jgi:hypothetical protein